MDTIERVALGLWNKPGACAHSRFNTELYAVRDNINAHNSQPSRTNSRLRNSGNNP